MPLNAGNIGIRPVAQQSPTGGVDGVQRRDDGSSSGGFKPQTNVALKTAIEDLAGTLSKISSQEKFGISKLQQDVGEVVKNILQQSFSVEETLSQGVGSTIESQRFAMEQLSTFARMLSQIGALADKGFSMELSDETQLLLSQLKNSIVTSEGGSALEPVLLSKTAFELIDSKTAEQLPQALAEILSILAAQTAAPTNQGQQSEGMNFLKQLVQYFMPRPSTETAGESEQTQTEQNKNQNQNQQQQNQNARSDGGHTHRQSATQQFLQSMFKNLGDKFSQLRQQPGQQQTQTQNQNPAQQQAQTQNQNPAQQQTQTQNQNPTQQQTQTQNQNPAQQQAQTQNQNPAQQQTQTQNQNPAQQQTQTQNQNPTQQQTQTQNQNPAQQQTQTQNQNPTQQQAQAQNQNPAQQQTQSQNQNQNSAQQHQQSSGRFKVSEEFLAKQIEMREQIQTAKTSLLRQPLQNNSQTMDAMKNLAQMLMRNNSQMSPRESTMLQNFVNNSQTMMSEGEARHLQNLLRLCQQNVPITVQQAAVQQNLPDLPRLWAFMQLCDMAALTNKMNARAFKRAGKDVAEFANAMRRAMSGDTSSVQTQRSFQMMLPLYMGDNETSYPTYLSVYDENETDKETGAEKKETWVRICLLTDNIGAVELTFRIYEENHLDMRFYFSRRDTADEFRNYIPDLETNLRDTTFQIGEVRIGSVGEKMKRP